MTPIKLTDFLSETAPKANNGAIDLIELGLYHAAPVEDGHPVLALRFDPQTGCLVPAS
jgi:hypothetical protein